MEFETEKCALLIVEKGEKETREGIELPDKETIGTKKKTTNTWLRRGNLERETESTLIAGQKKKKNARRTMSKQK